MKRKIKEGRDIITTLRFDSFVPNYHENPQDCWWCSNWPQIYKNMESCNKLELMVAELFIDV